MSAPRIPDPELLDFSAEREKKALSKKEPLTAQKEFLETLGKTSFSETERRRVLEALSLLESARLPEEKSYYRAHPLRVARYVARYEPGADADMLVLALTHNLMEVAGAKAEDLERRFGAWVGSACRSFEVDRSRQKTDPAYLRQFYSALASDRRRWLVKLFDKWDNVLSVYSNPSAELRAAYLDEIERFLLPLIKPPDGLLGDAFGRLIAETRKPVVR